MRKFEFFFDVLSPYSYMAFQWLYKNKAAIHEKGFQIEIVPVTLATVITHYKTLGPAQIGPKRDYLFRDLLRLSKVAGIPFTTPKVLPFNSLYGLRLSLKEVSGEDQFFVVNELFKMGWAKGLDLGNIDEIQANFHSFGYTKIDELIEKISSKEVRLKLKENVEYALKKEIFGVPTMILDDKELFWGNDSLAYVEAYMNGNDPLDHKAYEEILKKHDFTSMEQN